jgi:multiple sugar transport system permease protein
LPDTQVTEVVAADPAAPTPPLKHKPDWISKAASRRGFLLSLPAWILMIPLFFVPLAVGAYLSFFDKTLGFPMEPSFVGLENYRTEILNPVFYEALFKTLVILALGLLLQFPLGMVIALALHRRFIGRGFFRTLVLLPMLLTPVAVGLMWRFMYNPELGIINWWLTSLGLPSVDWLGSPWPAVFAVTIVDSWQALSLVVLLILAGLSSLDEGPAEAAKVDGASSWQLFRHITLPALMPILLVTLMIRVIDGFKIFDVIFILTRGGPGIATQTVSLLDYNVAFTFLATSRASAIGVVLVLLTLPIYFLWRKVVTLQGSS